MTQAEKNYSPVEGEALAIVWGLSILGLMYMVPILCWRQVVLHLLG